ncbi:spindle assembly abnormal protein 6 homolog [Pomacea canaliculata]|uniref:spindle assembly abnormal protein 6 homolog n=1 Tax=Pomacea canaliculata TaxID=400727 RepID=UPI000D7360B7|nr:spindle assembly abnormal protein 6 homolog [Pomacea canaliculata]
MDELFSKRLPVIFKSHDREDRRGSVFLKMEVQALSAPLTRKELVVRLTDDKDLFFLYTLRLGEEDFQSLKSQQGLLVDYGAFPQKFIDLLEMCLQEEHRDSPKFVLHFTSHSSVSGEKSIAILNVVETNPFKHLIHLSLKFVPGSDADIKKYLADCLKQLKDTNNLLQQKLEHTNSDLSQRLRQAQDMLASKSAELESLKSEWNSRIGDLRARHKEEMAAEKEKAIQLQNGLQQRYDHDRREMEQAHARNVKQLESRLSELEKGNKDLTDNKYKCESQIRELKAKLTVTEEEAAHAKQEVTTLRKQNTAMDFKSHDQEKLMNQLQTRIAVLEQEVKDKEQLLLRSNELLQTQQDSRRKCEEDLEKRGKEVNKLEGKVRAMTEELKKGNEIIKKLQAEIKNYHTKVKLRTQIATEQERLLGEKDQELETLRQDLAITKEALKQKSDENKSLNDNLENTTQKLQECQKLLKTNENVIQWLNKQINEQQLLSHRLGTFEMPGATSSLRPTGGGLHNYSASSYVSAGSHGDVHLRNEMNPGMSVPRPHFNSHRPPQVQYNPMQANLRKSGLPVPSGAGRNGPPPPIPEESQPRANNHQAPPASGRLTDKENDPPIDPKYFEKRDDAIPLRGLLNRSASPPAAPASVTTASAPSQLTQQSSSALHMPGPSLRLSQQLIVPKASQPPLASAYFPGQGKAS